MMLGWQEISLPAAAWTARLTGVPPATLTDVTDSEMAGLAGVGTVVLPPAAGSPAGVTGAPGASCKLNATDPTVPVGVPAEDTCKTGPPGAARTVRAVATTCARGDEKTSSI